MNLSDSEDEGETASKQIKVVLLGDTATGKTCLARRLCGETVPAHHVATQGVEFRLKRTVLTVPRQQTSPAQLVPVTAELWDVAGDALEGGMIEQYIFGAQIVMLVFDIASAASLDGLTEWLERTKKVTAQNDKKPLITVIGNKFDLEHERAVRYENQLRFVHENGLTFHCVSARTGENIETCFQKILADVLGLRLTSARNEVQPAVGGSLLGPMPISNPVPATVHDIQTNQFSSACILQ